MHACARVIVALHALGGTNARTSCADARLEDDYSGDSNPGDEGERSFNTSADVADHGCNGIGNGGYLMSCFVPSNMGQLLR